MPAVVVEPGFITNPDDVKLLSQMAAAEPVVLAMVSAVLSYYSSSEEAR